MTKLYYLKNKTNLIHIVTLYFILLVATVASLLIGVKSILPNSVTLLKHSDLQILIISRIPRTVTLILTGAGLSICGIILQQLSHNKFISPTTSGTLDSAKLGILFSLFLFPQYSVFTKLLFSVLFCFGFTLLFIFSITKLANRNTVLVPILGIMFGYTLNSISNLFGVELNIVQNMESWMVGNFTKTLQGQYEIIYLMLPLFVICYLYARKFTIASMGRDFSTSLGINYQMVVIIGLILTSIMVSTTILTVGSLPFIDLIIPNIVAFIHGDNVRKNLPFTACYGALALLICDIVGRLIIYPYEIPVSMIVGSLGAVIFLIILTNRNR